MQVDHSKPSTQKYTRKISILPILVILTVVGIFVYFKGQQQSVIAEYAQKNMSAKKIDLKETEEALKDIEVQAAVQNLKTAVDKERLDFVVVVDSLGNITDRAGAVEFTFESIQKVPFGEFEIPLKDNNLLIGRRFGLINSQQVIFGQVILKNAIVNAIKNETNKEVHIEAINIILFIFLIIGFIFSLFFVVAKKLVKNSDSENFETPSFVIKELEIFFEIFGAAFTNIKRLKSKMGMITKGSLPGYLEKVEVGVVAKEELVGFLGVFDLTRFSDFLNSMSREERSRIQDDFLNVCKETLRRYRFKLTNFDGDKVTFIFETKEIQDFNLVLAGTDSLFKAINGFNQKIPVERRMPIKGSLTYSDEMSFDFSKQFSGMAYLFGNRLLEAYKVEPKTKNVVNFDASLLPYANDWIKTSYIKDKNELPLRHLDHIDSVVFVTELKTLKEAQAQALAQEPIQSFGVVAEMALWRSDEDLTETLKFFAIHLADLAPEGLFGFARAIGDLTLLTGDPGRAEGALYLLETAHQLRSRGVIDSKEWMSRFNTQKTIMPAIMQIVGRLGCQAHTNTALIAKIKSIQGALINDSRALADSVESISRLTAHEQTPELVDPITTEEKNRIEANIQIATSRIKIDASHLEWIEKRLNSHDHLFVLSALYAAAEIYKQRQGTDLKVGELKSLEHIESMITNFNFPLLRQRFAKSPQYFEVINRRHSITRAEIKRTKERLQWSASAPAKKSAQ